MTGLADCNNFFVSCERTRDSSLEGKAVVVLSNNDGCVVARSNEAKRLGVKMGQPAFEIRGLIDSGRVTALSGDHLLYRRISLQTHAIFRRFVPRTVDYSVDEAFLDVSGIPIDELPGIGAAIHRACLEEAGIPVTVGFAPTKTLSKLITEHAKKNGEPVAVLADQALAASIIDSLPIGELWGIGRRLAKKLSDQGVYTIGAFRRRNVVWIRRSLGVNGERSWRELHGEPCIDLSHVDKQMQDSISETRTFPRDVNDYEYVRTRIAIYAADCARKLRRMGGMCSEVSVFLRTNRFHTERGYQCPELKIRLAGMSDDTQTIAEAATTALDRIFNPALSYKRAGVILSGIGRPTVVTPSLFAGSDICINNPETSGKRHPRNGDLSRLSHVVDDINGSVGAVVRLAAQLTNGHPGHNDGYSSTFQAPSAES